MDIKFRERICNLMYCNLQEDISSTFFRQVATDSGSRQKLSAVFLLILIDLFGLSLDLLWGRQVSRPFRLKVRRTLRYSKPSEMPPTLSDPLPGASSYWRLQGTTRKSGFTIPGRTRELREPDSGGSGAGLRFRLRSLKAFGLAAKS